MQKRKTNKRYFCADLSTCDRNGGVYKWRMDQFTPRKTGIKDVSIEQSIASIKTAMQKAKK